MPDKDREIVVKIRCGEKTCGECQFRDCLKYAVPYCLVWHVYMGHVQVGRGVSSMRIQACLAAEAAALRFREAHK